MIPKGSIIESRYLLQRVVETDDTSCCVEGIVRQTLCIATPRRLGRVVQTERLRVRPRPTESQVWSPEEANVGMASFLTTNAFKEDLFAPGAGRPYARWWTLNTADIAVFLEFAGDEEAMVQFLLSLSKGTGTYPLVDRSAPGGAKHQRFEKGAFVQDPDQDWLADVLPQLSAGMIEHLASHTSLTAIRTAAASTADQLAHCA